MGPQLGTTPNAEATLRTHERQYTGVVSVTVAPSFVLAPGGPASVHQARRSGFVPASLEKMRDKTDGGSEDDAQTAEFRFNIDNGDDDKVPGGVGRGFTGSRPAGLMTGQELKPAIHLDNRYRLMRNEPMLDAEGRETDCIGEDETAPPDLDEYWKEITTKKGRLRKR
ncbi:hypothetical protein WN55_09014 [Dufourea novaeangliae]|uniref:Uncharacterized protein n=1 Tax=Dufourea novaeangliae TaxID=178035 RepID=A0A154P7Y2_DUFNO|nr:hypothetical protein WN55_09014 [Dufourea novaeangliae]